MTMMPDRVSFRALLALAGCLVCSAWGQQAKTRGSSVIEVSLCDLRNYRERFAGKSVQVEGWIYTDLENFSIGDGDCGVALMSPERPSNAGVQRFIGLIEGVKKGGFNTSDEVFVIARGTFETVAILRHGREIWSPGYGAGSSPSILAIQQVVCSTFAPRSSNTKTQAVTRCRQ